MIGDLCTLLRSQGFTGAPGVVSQKIDQNGGPRQIVVRRNGTDRNGTLETNDDSLIFLDVDFHCVASTAEETEETAEELVAWLNQVDDEPMGDWLLRCANLDDESDDADEPDDGSDDWEFATTVSAQLQVSRTP